MEAQRLNVIPERIHPEETIPAGLEPRMDSVAPGSGTRLAASERPTLPPGGAEAEDIMVSRIHLGPSVDEVLYRLSLGDLSGAALANEELEPYVPVQNLARVILDTMDLGYLEDYMLLVVDGETTWGDILDNSPFTPRDTLQALCELVDMGALTLTLPSRVTR